MSNSITAIAHMRPTSRELELLLNLEFRWILPVVSTDILKNWIIKSYFFHTRILIFGCYSILLWNILILLSVLLILLSLIIVIIIIIIINIRITIYLSIYLFSFFSVFTFNMYGSCCRVLQGNLISELDSNTFEALPSLSQL